VPGPEFRNYRENATAEFSSQDSEFSIAFKIKILKAIFGNDVAEQLWGVKAIFPFNWMGYNCHLHRV
jgi:hypothetical protein